MSECILLLCSAPESLGGQRLMVSLVFLGRIKISPALLACLFSFGDTMDLPGWRRTQKLITSKSNLKTETVRKKKESAVKWKTQSE